MFSAEANGLEKHGTNSCNVCGTFLGRAAHCSKKSPKNRISSKMLVSWTCEVTVSAHFFCASYTTTTCMNTRPQEQNEH